jgi:hypothetical protein
MEFPLAPSFFKLFNFPFASTANEICLHALTQWRILVTRHCKKQVIALTLLVRRSVAVLCTVALCVCVCLCVCECECVCVCVCV